MSEGGGSRVIMVTNIAPQATRDQMQTLFSYIGRIDDIRLYPSVRDASLSITSRVCFVKFSDTGAASIGTHLNNTVFIDRAIIVTPVRDGLVPDEAEGLNAANSSNNNKFSESKFPPNMTNSYQGNLVFTGDTLLDSAGLPGYPPMPASTSTAILEELRRTVTVSYIDPTVPAQQCMEFFSKEAGEVKYFRYSTRENDPVKYALIEFSNQSSVIAALLMNDQELGSSRIKVTHATTSIIKPTTKTNEDAQKEIEEALSRVKEAQSLVAATVDPLMGMLGGSTTSITGGGISSALARASRSRSRSRRRSRSRGRSVYSTRRSRSRSRHRRRSRSRRRKRSRSKRRRSRSKERRSRSKDKRSRSRDKRSRSKDRNGHDDRRKSRSRSKSRERKVRSKSWERKKSRSRSRDRKRSRSISRKRSRSRSRDKIRRSKSHKRRSRSREKRKRSKDRKSSRRSRSRSKKKDRRRSHSRDKSDTNGSSKKENRISRDYDEEEMGYHEDYMKEDVKISKHDREENFGTQDMEISNSP
ncbi:uncharacterized protein Srp54 [Lepeophtheirus salmonis]|uniref:Putative splicing factor, arginine/serinerich 7like [Bombus impatiens] n=1 Tax=Lepeophtheirus salmonis TaxID=72036 RepID=A0A0K2U685_LEPSM|nr:probable splicing factor, arginine/serine-rich 7 [Lepeophtheirus salmonis]